MTRSEFYWTIKLLYGIYREDDELREVSSLLNKLEKRMDRVARIVEKIEKKI